MRASLEGSGSCADAAPIATITTAGATKALVMTTSRTDCVLFTGSVPAGLAAVGLVPAVPFRETYRMARPLSKGGGIVMVRPILLAALISAALPAGARAQTADDLKGDGKTPSDVLTY